MPYFFTATSATNLGRIYQEENSVKHGIKARHPLRSFPEVWLYVAQNFTSEHVPEFIVGPSGAVYPLLRDYALFWCTYFIYTKPTTDVSWLPLRLKSRRVAPSRQLRQDVRHLRDECVTQEYKRELAGTLDEPNDFDDPEIHRTDFQTKILTVLQSCLRGTSGTSQRFLVKESLNTIEERVAG